MFLIHSLSSVLTKTGYKNVQALEKGDDIFDGNGNIYSITNITKYENTTSLIDAGILKENQRVYQLYYDNWFNKSYVLENDTVLICNKQQEDFDDNQLETNVLSKKSIKDIEKNSTMDSTIDYIGHLNPLSNYIGEADYTENKYNEDYGHLIGLYMGFGNMFNDRLFFTFNKEYPNIEDIKMFLSNMLLDGELNNIHVEKTEFNLIIQFKETNEKIRDLYTTFGSGYNKRVPHECYQNNSDYLFGFIKGISGVIENDIKLFVLNYSLAYFITFACSCLGLHYHVYRSNNEKPPFELNINDIQEQYDEYIGKIRSVSILEEDDTSKNREFYLLETNSTSMENIIVNNIIFYKNS